MPTWLEVSAATHVFPHQRACKCDRRDPGVWRRAVGPGQGCSRGKHNARFHNSWVSGVPEMPRWRNPDFSLTEKRHQVNPNWGTDLQYGATFLQSMSGRGRWRYCCGIVTGAMHDGLDPLVEKRAWLGHCWVRFSERMFSYSALHPWLGSLRRECDGVGAKLVDSTQVCSLPPTSVYRVCLLGWFCMCVGTPVYMRMRRPGVDVRDHPRFLIH